MSREIENKPDSKAETSLAESQTDENVEFGFLPTEAAIRRGTAEKRMLRILCRLGIRDTEQNTRKQEEDAQKDSTWGLMIATGTWNRASEACLLMEL